METLTSTETNWGGLTTDNHLGSAVIRNPIRTVEFYGQPVNSVDVSTISRNWDIDRWISSNRELGLSMLDPSNIGRYPEHAQSPYIRAERIRKELSI